MGGKESDGEDGLSGGVGGGGGVDVFEGGGVCEWGGFRGGWGAVLFLGWRWGVGGGSFGGGKFVWGDLDIWVGLFGCRYDIQKLGWRFGINILMSVHKKSLTPTVRVNNIYIY